jgi:prophage tail gpP-like protein
MTLTVDVSAPVRAPNELVLEVNGQQLAGWEDIELSLLLEGFPNSFSIGLSSRSPITSAATVAHAGDECAVYLGNDQVISGYIDRDVPGGDAGSHSIKILGRGKTQDLVDCSAEYPSAQLQGNALDIATKLASFYNLTVILGDGAKAGDQVPSLCLNYTETAAAIIQRLARNAGLLAYEDSNGRLVLGTLGTKQAASGIAYGQNVQSWSIETGMDQRFSEVVCSWQGLAAWGDLPGSDFFDTEPDPNVPRHRRLCIVLEQVAEKAQDFTIKKAKWEVARRAGRGTVVKATIDSWRDSAGTLWAPNMLVPVSLPGLRLTDKLLCLSAVTFKKSNEGGTTADLTLLPKFAFLPEPISLLPLNAGDAL